ncbi:uncharacterized protein LOC115919435 [Strongylocentrotus purpuratus]|uniref:DUF5050 domain-containing protein n=1 Tax=Strongylocentrotus purpuratus TaxID=7668 RepID=A0A7M7MZT3_STRPU|nr:uncharacterized protein LOC115919435 [Strongylocentrotus purpuratus]
MYLIAFDHENELVYAYNETLGHVEIYMENGTHVATKAKLNQIAKLNQTLFVMRLDLKNHILYWLAKESETSVLTSAVYECRLTEESWIEPLNISGFYYDLTIDSEGIVYLVGKGIVRIRRINNQSYETEHIKADNNPLTHADIDDNGLLYYQRLDGSITSVDTKRNQPTTPVTYYQGKNVDCIRVYGGVLYWYIQGDGIIYTKSLDKSTNDGQMELTPGEYIVFYIIPVS